jgi:hypothetical protein
MGLLRSRGEEGKKVAQKKQDDKPDEKISVIFYELKPVLFRFIK